MAVTTNYGWTKPTVGGDSGAWGTILNTLFDAVDSALFTVSGVASAALAKAGGVMTGRIDVKTATDQYVDKGNMTGAVTLDLANANAFKGTVTGNVTSLTISNVPATATSVCALLLKLTNPGAFTITWPGSFKWPSGSAPLFTASGVDLIAAVSYDGGTTWNANIVQKDSR